MVTNCKHYRSLRDKILLFPYNQTKSSIQVAFKEACRKAKIKRHVSVHHLRHAYAVLKYPALYIFRIAISNRNILGCKDGQVAFRYKDSDTGQFKTMTLNAMEFIRR